MSGYRRAIDSQNDESNSFGPSSNLEDDVDGKCQPDESSWTRYESRSKQRWTQKQRKQRSLPSQSQHAPPSGSSSNKEREPSGNAGVEPSDRPWKGKKQLYWPLLAVAQGIRPAYLLDTISLTEGEAYQLAQDLSQAIISRGTSSTTPPELVILFEKKTQQVFVIHRRLLIERICFTVESRKPTRWPPMLGEEPTDVEQNKRRDVEGYSSCLLAQASEQGESGMEKTESEKNSTVVWVDVDSSREKPTIFDEIPLCIRSIFSDLLQALQSRSPSPSPLDHRIRSFTGRKSGFISIALDRESDFPPLAAILLEYPVGYLFAEPGLADTKTEQEGQSPIAGDSCGSGTNLDGQELVVTSVDIALESTDRDALAKNYQLLSFSIPSSILNDPSANLLQPIPFQNILKERYENRLRLWQDLSAAGNEQNTSSSIGLSIKMLLGYSPATNEETARFGKVVTVHSGVVRLEKVVL